MITCDVSEINFKVLSVMKKVLSCFIGVLLCSCLTLPAPTYYNYKLVHNDSKMSQILRLSDSIRMSSSFTLKRPYKTVQYLEFYNHSNEKKIIDKYNFQIEPNLLKYDSIIIKTRQKKDYRLQKGPIQIAPDSKLDFLIEYWNNEQRREKIEDEFKQKWTRDTLTVRINLNDDEYFLKFIADAN